VSTTKRAFSLFSRCEPSSTCALVIATSFFCVCSVSAYSQSDADIARAKEILRNALKEKAQNKELRLRMFAERNGDLYWMDTNSIVPTTKDNRIIAGVTVYFVKGGYPSERQQLTSACCGIKVVTREPEGTPTDFQFDCSGDSYTINRSSPQHAAPLSVVYNISQFACAGARCKLNQTCSDE
jgi:hypothetical protein